MFCPLLDLPLQLRFRAGVRFVVSFNDLETPTPHHLGVSFEVSVNLSFCFISTHYAILT